ncbi:NADH-dependent alcohol dehydrogenase [Francisella halioticida]|uniref:NADH-dependent alcohol dehydrogenase n=2 Tax=Francisella halioticida TaxID=549298 RepID=A0ABN5B2Z4_9GAMM|nr:iron-containing alcohol dehydrogenase [Francisella halioticida]ASG68048.1 NADH-dependent alcohol dehydrogenase [Francisella halioticida]
MQNFEYYNPVKIFFGKGEIAKVAEAISKDKKILIIYGGGSIKKNGVYQQVKNALTDHNTYEFSGIEPNPEYETCMKAVEYIKENNIDFILAVGGGSVIDATKFISAAVKFDGQPWDILAKGAEIKETVDFGTVLTIPATGSEMNAAAVISRREIDKKRAFMNEKVFPKFSILDPEVTYTLPARQVANGVVDAFVHVIEQYLTFPQNAPLQDRFAEAILLTLIEEGGKVIHNPDDYDVRANIMWSATMALNSVISRGVAMDWSTHMIGHELTTFYGLDHAQTLAIILPSIMQHKRDRKGDKIAQYAERVWGVPRSVSKDEKIDIAIIKTVEFFEKMGNPTRLVSYNFNSDQFDKIVKSLETNGMNALGEHQDITLEDTRKILEMSL